MKKHTHIALKIIFAALFLLQSSNSFAQNEKEVQEIIKNYDLKKLKQMEAYFSKKVANDKQKALEAAKKNNWPVFKRNDDGSYDELMKLTPDGYPIYYSQSNLNAAKSTRTNILQTTFAVNGEGMVARIWDGGKVRASHQEFGGRVTVVDDAAGPSGNNFHATHVTGTVIASGVVANAKGMAPLAQARTFDWTDDIVEAISEVQLGMLLSNHSYGVPSNTGVPSWYIGAYTDDSRVWDWVAYESPYYLQVVSAGNNGTDANPNPSTTGYDKLTGNKVSKNNLVVANALDAVILGNGTMLPVNINGGSSQGPADDLRIKPDITGNGTDLYSSLETSNTAYGSLTGTSMSAPNVTGTLLLYQQLYKNINMRFMKAATLKALACHTADEAGNPGPDAKFGWGMLNGKKAGELITNDGLNSLITEETLAQGQTFTYEVVANGTTPLQATIAWTDLPGQATSILNNPSPRLVNDLDLRITKGTSVFYPWRLQSAANLNALKDGDNNVDNIERVDVTGASGTYTITVTHKGTLQDGPQNFSLIISGASSNFALTPTSPDRVICSSEATTTFSFNYKTSTATPTTFSAVGLPVGATATFSVNSLSANGPVTMTISNLQNAPAGNYVIGFKGVGGTETEIKNVNLRVFQPVSGNVALLSPTDNQEALATTVKLDWENHVNSQSYIVQLSTNSSFSNLLVNTPVNESQYVVSNLNEATKYYWRVLSVNPCGQATTNNYFSFDTGNQLCNNIFNATDFSNAAIASVENSTGFVPITVTGGMNIGKLSVNLDLTHEYLGDVMVYLEGPAAIGSPRITLFEEPCDSSENILATITDGAASFTCGNFPAISGVVAPRDPLSTFNNLPADGEWKLYVIDSYENDGGMINAVSLNFCTLVSANLSLEEQEIAKIAVFPNPTSGSFTVQLPDNGLTTTLTVFDIQGRKMQSQTANGSNANVNIGNLQEGVYVLAIENEKYKTSKKIVLHK